MKKTILVLNVMEKENEKAKWRGIEEMALSKMERRRALARLSKLKG
jgi:hypothetical protein